MIFYVVFFSLLLLLDFITKYVSFVYVREPFVLLAGIAKIKCVLNTGIALSLFSKFGAVDQNSIIVFTGIVLFLFFLYFLRQLACGGNILPDLLVLAGGCGNVLSRFLYGGVIDFFEISFYGYNSSVFNLADVYISVGLLLILFRAAYEST